MSSATLDFLCGTCDGHIAVVQDVHPGDNTADITCPACGERWHILFEIARLAPLHVGTALTKRVVGAVKPESFSVFTGTLADYGSRLPNGTIGTKEAAEYLLKQINEQPERYALVRDGVPYRVKRVWIEEDFEEREAGRVMVEYERSPE